MIRLLLILAATVALWAQIPLPGSGGGGSSSSGPSITYGTYSALPATCTTGDQYRTSDSVYEFQCTATNTWTAFYGGIAVTVPVSGDFAWVNQGTATVTSGAGAIVLYAAALNGSNSLKIRKKTAPATPYTVEAGFDCAFGFTNFAECGLLFRQSSDGKIATAAIQYNTGLISAVAKWTNETTYSANYTLTAPPNGQTRMVFMRIADDGTNRVTSWSPNKKDWYTLHSVTRTDFLTANEVGFFANNSNNIAVYMNLFHWREF